MSDQHLDNYIRLITEVLPSNLSNLDMAIDNRERHFGALPDEEKEDMLGTSFFFSSNQLRAAADSLHTLMSLSHVSDGSIQVIVTQNGVAGLLREALEAIATFKWLNDCSSDDEARAKAHSYSVQDLQERLNYYKDLGDSENLAKSDGLLADAIQLGLDRGYTTESTNKKGEPILKPLCPLPNTTDLMDNVKTPKTVITPTVLSHYPGMENSKWMYRWSSGLSHSKHWVTNFTTLKDGTKRTVPNYINLNVMLLTITQELDKIISDNNRYQSFDSDLRE